MATVQKRGNSYKITSSCGYDVRGEQIRRYMTWTPAPKMTEKQIEKEIARQMVLFDEECKNNIEVSRSIKFEAFAKQWFQEYAERELKHRTVSRYRQMEARVYAAMGHLRLDKITTRTIQKFILSLGEEGVNKRNHKALAPKTIKNYHAFISSIFNYAIRQHVMKENPCIGVSLPSVKQSEQTTYTIEEAQRFLKLLEKEPPLWEVYYTLAIFGGFRRGEILGLEWKDIHFKNKTISIVRTSLYTKENGVYTDTPKTRGSCRTLRMPDSVMELLSWYKARQAEERLKVGDRWEDYDRLFAGWNGKPLNPSCVENWLSRFLKRTGMPRITPHGFRHLNATLLIGSGADVKTVSTSLGHSQASTTLNIYAHSFAAAQAKAADAIANVLTFDKSGTTNTK